MARRSRMSVLKRQRELRKAEKAARKRARRHGLPEDGLREPVPSVGFSSLSGLRAPQEENAEAPPDREEPEKKEEPEEA